MFRWGLSKEERNVDKVQKDLYSLFPVEDWNKVSLQVSAFHLSDCIFVSGASTDDLFWKRRLHCKRS